jgi:predicted ArsR family transcriptional regulator
VKFASQLPPAGAEADGGTRARVQRLILESGPQTAAALGERLGLSPAAVRRHLDTLIAEGAVVARETPSRGPRGRGRPARAYALTETGHASGPQSYDDLASHALRWLGTHGGPEAVGSFARARAAELETRLAGVHDAASLAEALSADGYAATVQDVPTGTTVCQHHCPVQSVAAEFPQLCEAETEAIARVLGTHVQRLATIAHGDGVCTTHVPAAAGTTAPPAGAHTETPVRTALTTPNSPTSLGAAR